MKVKLLNYKTFLFRVLGLLAAVFFFQLLFACSLNDNLEEEPHKDAFSELWKYQVDPEEKEVIKAWKKLSPSSSCKQQTINVPKLPEINKDNVDLLMRHFASSAKWRVTRDNYVTRKSYITANNRNVLIQKRVVLDGSWTLSPLIVNHYYDQSSKIGGSSEFSVYPKGNRKVLAWKNMNYLSGQGIHRIKTFRSDNPQNSSYSILNINDFSIEISEMSPFCERVYTQIAILDVIQEINSVLKSKKIKEKGYDSSLLPSQSVVIGQPKIRISDGGQSGIYFVDAFVNPGIQGYVYLKLIEQEFGQTLDSESVEWRSIEYTGWSTNPQEQFFYNSRVYVPTLWGWQRRIPVKFELWLKPTDTSQSDRLLVSETFQVYGWQR